MSIEIEIPEGLRPIKPKMDRAAMVRRAELLLNQCREADARGLLSQRRVGEALSELNIYYAELGAALMRCANDPRLMTLERRRVGIGIKGPHGSLAQVTEFSAVQDAYERIDAACKEITILWETKR